MLRRNDIYAGQWHDIVALASTLTQRSDDHLLQWLVS
jgi:hypothetical protein